MPKLSSTRLVVVGVDAVGAEVARLALGHGDDPTLLLAAAGWQVQRVRDVTSDPVESALLTLTFVVEPSLVEPSLVEPSVVEPSVVEPSVVEPSVVEPSLVGPSRVDPKGATLMTRTPRLDDDLVIVEGEVAVRHQRVAAYALVTSSRGVLMTQFSDRTNAAGQWGLPGGGLEAGEGPDSAVVREVWEESGQVIDVSELESIQTSHWVGRSPAGQLEDFHAVRVIYRAVCPEPTEPVVHDVGGTTASAAWVRPTDLDRLAVTAGWRSVLDVVMAPDETDGPNQRHHDTYSDDGPGT